MLTLHNNHQVQQASLESIKAYFDIENEILV